MEHRILYSKQKGQVLNRLREQEDEMKAQPVEDATFIIAADTPDERVRREREPFNRIQECKRKR